LFFSFPDSFSAALMGYATGAKTRVGYKKEGRQILLTHTWDKPSRLHRVKEYTGLLERFSGQTIPAPKVLLQHPFEKKDYVVVNINSEAESRRLTEPKAVEVLTAVQAAYAGRILLIGGKREERFVNEVISLLPDKTGIESVAGQTSLPQLAEVLASARAVLTTDSGPAHLANALGTQTVVLFGAGNEANTAPYNNDILQVLRLGQLSCEPCTRNVCVRYGKPQCLERLSTPAIVDAFKQRIHVASTF
jgi:ADP-heptose:LPS heptosyltransferase